jgi:hypothetical protein
MTVNVAQREPEALPGATALRGQPQGNGQSSSPTAGKRLSALWETALLAVAVAVMVPALSLFCYDFYCDPGPFNSDHLLCTALCQDILAGHDLHGWHLPGAPYLFPDVPLLLICRALTPNLVAEFTSYTVAFLLLLLAVLRWLARVLGLPGRKASLTAVCAMVLLLGVALHPAYHGRVMLMAHAGNHVGAVLIGLLLVTLTARSLRRGWSAWTVAAFVTCGALGLASDKLLAVQLLAPLALALLLLAWRRYLAGRQLVRQAALQAATVALALGVRAALPLLGWFLLGVENDFRWPQWRDLPQMLRFLAHCNTGQTLFWIFLPLFLVIAFRVAASRWRQRPPATLPADEIETADLRGMLKRWRGLWQTATSPEIGETARLDSAAMLVALAFLLCPLCNLLALFATGLGTSTAVDRYTLPCYLLPFLGSALLLRLLPGRKARWAATLIQLFGLVWAVRQAAVMLPACDLERLRVPYPPLAQALDRLVEERGPMRGLAGYWLARHLEYLTHHHVPVQALDLDGNPYFHASNPSHFLGYDRADLALPRYDFVVVRPKVPDTPSPRVLEEHFGKPAEKVLVDADEIWLYRPIESPPFNAFLRARLAERARRQVAFTAPDAPACLGRPKANLSSPDARGVIHLGLNQPLEVRFAAPVSGPVLELAAGAADRLRLEFYRAGRLQGSLAVPAVPWTGATYGPPGIQARLLAVPQALQARGWDRVVVVPTRPDARVGHLLVYHQDLPGLWPSTRGPDIAGARAWRLVMDLVACLPDEPWVRLLAPALPPLAGYWACGEALCEIVDKKGGGSGNGPN